MIISGLYNIAKGSVINDEDSIYIGGIFCITAIIGIILILN